MSEFSLVVSGVVVPPVVSLIKQAHWPVRVKFLLSIATSFAVASVAMAISGEFGSFNEYIGKVSFVWAESQIIYQMYFGGTGFDGKLTSIGSSN